MGRVGWVVDWLAIPHIVESDILFWLFWNYFYVARPEPELSLCSFHFQDLVQRFVVEVIRNLDIDDNTVAGLCSPLLPDDKGVDGETAAVIPLI